MNRFPPWYGARLDHTEPGVDPEVAAQAYWSRVDAAYEQWRDDQMLAAVDPNTACPSPDHDHPSQA